MAEAVAAGQSPAAAAISHDVPRHAIYVARRADAGFLVRYTDARRRSFAIIETQRADRKRRRLQLGEDRFAPFRAQEQFRQALRSDEVYGAVHAAARRLPPEMRDDVISDLIVAVLDGDITIADLPREVSRFRDGAQQDVRRLRALARGSDRRRRVHARKQHGCRVRLRVFATRQAK